MKEIKKPGFKQVIIVGLGFAGIGLAKGLALETSYKISIFERDESIQSRSQGYTIGLQQEGIDCIFNKLKFKETNLFSPHSSSGIAIYGSHLTKYPLLKIKNILQVNRKIIIIK